MKKIFSILAALVVSVAMWGGTRTIYLAPNSNWTQSNAWFAVYAFGNGTQWYQMTSIEDKYQATIDDKYPTVIFCRMDPASNTLDWNNKWNQTGDLTLPTDGKNLFTVPSGEWDGSTTTWSTYTPPADPVLFYVTGDSALVVDAGLAASKAWNADAIESKADTLTLSLKAGVDYKLKVFVGSSWKGYSDLTEVAEGLNSDADGNICFRLNAAGDVKVIYTSSLFKLVGDFYVKPVVKKTIKLVPKVWANEGSPKFAAWIWGDDLSSQWTDFFTGTGDTLSAQINADADSITFVRMNSALTEPKWNSETETNNVWNQTVNEKIDYESLTYTITGWGEGEGAKSTGTWEAYNPAKFYITGDSALVVDAGLDKAKAWTADAIKSTADSYILSLKAGVDYKLKVTDGTWYDATNNPDAMNAGFDQITAGYVATGLSKDDDNNICFKLATAGNVVVTYTDNLFKLEGNFYAPQVVKKTVKFVPGTWATESYKYAAWIWGDDLSSQWTGFFTGSGDTLSTQINAEADSIIFVRFASSTASPSWEAKEYQTVDEKIDYESLVYTITGLGEGEDPKATGTWEAYCVESYGLLVNGVYHAGTYNALQTEWKEYMLRNVELTKGDSLQVYSVCADASWVISTFSATSHEFEIKNNKYVVDKTGTYDFYFKFIWGGDEVYIAQHGFYGSAVPSECTDVLMQAFFNESYSDDAPGVSSTNDYKLGLGNTRWSTLLGQAEEISSYFDLVWLPPSANGDGMGYHPKNYSNQSSNWGSATELRSLIDALHNGGTKVVADIVINHCQSTTGWLGFPEFDFGEYGKFTPTGAWVCKDDEVNTDPSAGSDYGKATGNYDDGDNWSGARDWAHDMPEVQNMFKAYLQWIRETVGYDGFRYDKGDGFNNWHHDNYNKASGPYIAFMESYNSSSTIKYEIEQANMNLMALDFDTKWSVFNAFASWNYGLGRGSGLISDDYWKKYAVTFIDSHDWFLRSDNENEFGGRGNSLTETMKIRLLQCNAFLLSMPGIPCVFYPHWAKYKDFIKPMIEARKLAGVHNESEVKDEYAQESGYQATIVGKYGYLILCLGDKATNSGSSKFGSDYELKASYYNYDNNRENYEIWVNRVTPLPTDVETTESPVLKAEKVMKDGQLFIRMGEKTFDMTGREVK
ncbi:MAG: hypothetical protein IJS82_03025 [Paludibacteraceae bacterium]|nr:hypothetical protein [Paludibacteraceae bacterium]